MVKKENLETITMYKKGTATMSRTPSNNTEFPGWYIELQVAMLRQLPRPGEINQEIAEYWSKIDSAGFKKALCDCLLPSPIDQEILEPILEYAWKITVTKTSSGLSEFIPRERFVCGNASDGAKVEICNISNSFSQCFLKENFKKVEDSKSCGGIIRVHITSQKIIDNERVIVELGGKNHARTTIGMVYNLMVMHANNRDVLCVKNDWVNVFYVTDYFDVLRAVYLKWCDSGWSLSASSVTHTPSIHSGYLVYSPE